MDRLIGKLDVVECCMIEAYTLTPNEIEDSTIWDCVVNIVDTVSNFAGNGRCDELDLCSFSGTSWSFSVCLYNIVCHYLGIFRSALPNMAHSGGCVVDHHLTHIEVGQRESSTRPY